MPMLRIARARSARLLSCTSLIAFAAPALAQEVDEGYTLDEVIVTAPRTEAPLTVTTDPQAPRQPVPAADGGGYLKTIPGFSMVRKGGHAGDPVLRGLSGSRIGILLDGTSLLGGCGGRMDPPTAYVFPESYDSITVIKGPQTVRYGGGHLAGTVLIDRETERFDEPGFRGLTSLTVGSFERNDELIDLTGGAPQGYVRFIGTRSESDNYEDGDGNEVHSFYERLSGTAILGWTPDADTLIEASADISEAEAAYADRGMDGVVFDREGYKLSLERGHISPLLSKASAEVYYNYIDHVMDNFSLRDNAGMKMLKNPDRTTWGGRAEMELNAADNLVLTVGADYRRDEHTIRTGVDYESKPRLPDQTFNALGVFTDAKWYVGTAGTVLMGLRGDFVKVENEAVTPNETVHDDLVSGFARYEHDFSETTVFAAVGHSQRTADWWERNRVFDLDPERSTQLDVGAIWNSGPWQASVSAYAANIDDYIIIQSVAPMARNVDATMLGGEAELSYAFLRNWRATATLAYTWGENRTDDEPLPQVPPLQGTAELRYDDGTFLGGVLLRAATEQDRVDVGSGSIVGLDIGPTSGYAVLSANMGYRPYDNVVVTAGVDNILDATYAEHVNKGQAYTLPDEPATVRVNEPGRTFWLRASIRF